MFNIGDFRAKTCSGTTRRSFLQAGAAVPIAMGMGNLASTVQAAQQAKAKSVIFVWLWGAPSHLDMFDPKPEAAAEYRGPFAPIATKQPGVHFTELLPKLAARADKFSLIRSHITFDGGHPGAGTIGVTGFKENPEPVQPNFGAISARYHGHSGELPPFFYIGRGIPRDLPRRIKGYGGGKLGKAYDPFLVSCSEIGDVEIPALKLLNGITPNRITDRRKLMRQLDNVPRTLEHAKMADWDRTWQTAYGLLTTPKARNAFDLTREKEAIRAEYGYTTFGQSCLLARRLVQTGVPYIQVNWSEYVEAMSPGCDFGWDTHIYNFELLQDRHCPIFDRAFSALIDDLSRQGLLDSTLVVAMGEFGRTPKINRRSARDHWPNCYFSLWAGAGVQPGRTIGKSDKLAQNPVTTPITPVMVGTTIAEQSGIDTAARAELKVLDKGTVIDELF
jgi:hypothetical protein